MEKVICFDLDDTLYKEIDYLKSAYKEIAAYAADYCRGCSDSPVILAAKAYGVMLEAYTNGRNAFECLNEFLGVSLPISEYLNIYRTHRPKIHLNEEAVCVLNALKAEGCGIGLITDGRSLQQRNKIDALGLHRWIADGNIVISEEFGSEKPSLANYEYFMQRYPDCKDFTYVGDNPKKDFIAPNVLGWQTICLADDGRNIHRQTMVGLAKEYLPNIIIKSLTEITKVEYCLKSTP